VALLITFLPDFLQLKCVMMYSDIAKAGRWNDEICSKKASYFCKMKKSRFDKFGMYDLCHTDVRAGNAFNSSVYSKIVIIGSNMLIVKC
jgi:hypothetical protein